jgi:hypothetical protein
MRKITETIAMIAGVFIAALLALVGLGSTIYIYNLIVDDSAIDVEYQIEIIDEHVVKIRNRESGRIYTVPMDSIQVTLEKDNL